MTRIIVADNHASNISNVRSFNYELITHTACKIITPLGKSQGTGVPFSAMDDQGDIGVSSGALQI